MRQIFLDAQAGPDRSQRVFLAREGRGAEKRRSAYTLVVHPDAENDSFEPVGDLLQS